MDHRRQKGIQIISEKNIKSITANHYLVESQSQNKTYHIRKLSASDVWTCECADFHYRLRTQDDKNCKHIISCQILQDTIRKEKKIEPANIDAVKACPKCHSTTIKKNGFRKLKDQVRRQRYLCSQCGHRFVLTDSSFMSMRVNPQIITESLNLVMSGVSYRNTARHIYSVHSVEVSHTSVKNWIGKYTYVIKEYVESFYPQLGDVWSLDEMYLNVKNTKKTGKGFHDWLWSIIDPKTRFLIATEVSKRRQTGDARRIIAAAKNLTDRDPRYVVTDSLNSYRQAIREELDSRKTAHVKTRSLKDGFANRPIERYHNEIRERLKARRGLGNDRSAQTFSELLKINHNFVKPHQGLGGKTPAQKAGIDLRLGDNKYLDLIRQADAKPDLASCLGKRIKKVTIVNEGNSIKITPKEWIDKPVWREINDILRLSGFSWLSNGKDSCWLKMPP